MAKLVRVGDGEGYQGSMVQSIKWKEDGSVDKINETGRPTVGESMRVGTVTAGMYSDRDWWMTTPVTEIIKEETNEEGKLTYVMFKTENSVYEIFA